MGEFIIMNKLFPEWKPQSSFIINHLERALASDAQRSSHPIQIDVADPSQINQIVRVQQVLGSFNVPVIHQLIAPPSSMSYPMIRQHVVSKLWGDLR